MTQALYAHMNNKRKRKRKSEWGRSHPPSLEFIWQMALASLGCEVGSLG
jgi:hypothetical protein